MWIVHSRLVPWQAGSVERKIDRKRVGAPSGSTALPNAARPAAFESGGPCAHDEVHDQRDHGKHEQYVNQPAGDVQMAKPPIQAIKRTANKIVQTLMILHELVRQSSEMMRGVTRVARFGSHDEGLPQSPNQAPNPRSGST